MKTFIKSLFAAIVATLALVACSKEVQVPVEDNEGELIEVTLIAGNPGTKTEMDGTTPYWSVGDKIGVTTGTSTANYEFSTGIASASTTATFTGETVSGNLYAYYPYTGNGVTADGKAKVDLPANQNPTASSFDGAADIMVAKQFTVSPANTTVSGLQFARLGAIVKIVLIDKDHTMSGTQHPTTVSMTAGSNLAGRVYVDMPNQELGEIYYNPSTTVTANYTAGTKYAIDGTNATYLIVYPQTLAEDSHLIITASTEDYTLSKDITVPVGGVDFRPGRVTTLKINFEAANISASAGAALPFNDNMAWANNGASESNADIGSNIATESGNLYTTGTKAYKGIGGLKLGSSSSSGSITTKELNLSGAFYIVIESGKYGSDTGTLEVSVDGDDVITGGSMSGTNYVNIAAGTYTNKSKVTIATSAKRGYIYSVNIASGTYVPAPVITGNGTNFTITCATAGATIYYETSTIDMASVETPTKSSSVYSGAVAITETTYVKAYAVKDGYDSAVASQTCEYSSGTTVNVTISSYATANSWTNASMHTSVTIDSNITASKSGSGTNSGNYYTSSPAGWRFYESEASTCSFMISASGTHTIKSVTVEYNNKNNGTLIHSESDIASGTKVNVNASSISFTVGRTSGSNNGQVAISKITVEYN